MRFFRLSKIAVILLCVAFVALLGAWGGVRAHFASAAAGDGSWTTYMNAYARTGYNGAESLINTTSAPDLKLKWTATTSGCLNSPGGAANISSEPVVLQSLQMIFWGSWDGCEHATDLNGNQVWATYLGQVNDSNCHPSIVGVGGTATFITEAIGGVSTPVVLVGGGDGNFYALNALTGAVIWKTPLGTATGSFLWSSPAVYRGSVYEGLSSQSDCPLVQGKFFRLNAATGAIQNTFDTVPNGCIGGSVWGSPAIDAAANTVYFATGNPGFCKQTELYEPALIELSVPNLSYVGSWQVPKAQQVYDSDFGSTPTLFQATINSVLTPMVGLMNKNGVYYAFARGNVSAGPVWQATVAAGVVYSSSAWNGINLFVGAGWANISGTSCQGAAHTGSLREVNPATGAFIWQDCFTTGQVQAPVSAIPGVVVVGAGTALQVVAASSGRSLFTFNDPIKGAIFEAGASISNGVLYVGDSQGNLYAFAP